MEAGNPTPTITRESSDASFQKQIEKMPTSFDTGERLPRSFDSTTRSNTMHSAPPKAGKCKAKVIWASWVVFSITRRPFATAPLTLPIHRSGMMVISTCIVRSSQNVSTERLRPNCLQELREFRLHDRRYKHPALHARSCWHCPPVLDTRSLIQIHSEIRQVHPLRYRQGSR